MKQNEAKEEIKISNKLFSELSNKTQLDGSED